MACIVFSGWIRVFIWRLLYSLLFKLFLLPVSVTLFLERLWRMYTIETPFSLTLKTTSISSLYNVFRKQYVILKNFTNRQCKVSFLEPSLIWIRVKSYIFWDTTPCSPLKVNLCFGEIFCLHLHGRRISQAINKCESRCQARDRILHNYRCENLRSYMNTGVEQTSTDPSYFLPISLTNAVIRK
jgi:hypothetical protein